MAADFWAGYISGAAGILIGNPLDLIKVRLQATSSLRTSSTLNAPWTYRSQFSTAGSLIRGSTAPILGTNGSDLPPSLWTTWIAGAIGGLATWVVSTPTELVKCRAQISTSSTSSSWTTTKQILRTEGVRGLYCGGVVTALRDSVGYGFYFCAYEWSTRLLMAKVANEGTGASAQEAAKVLLCGGFAGVVTWASIFPLDVIKTRVQTQPMDADRERVPLLGGSSSTEGVQIKRLGAFKIARNAYRTEGATVFFRGLGICSLRAFIVNAAQWSVYEWMMRQLDPS